MTYHPTADTFFKSIVEGFISHAILLVSAIKAVTGLSQLVILASILGNEINRDPVVAILVDDTDNAHVNLVHFEARLVLELLSNRAFPLSAC